MSSDFRYRATVLRDTPKRRAISRSDNPWALSTWICIHCSFRSIVGLRAKSLDCTEKWLRFTLREVAHYYFARNTGIAVTRQACRRIPLLIGKRLAEPDDARAYMPATVALRRLNV